MVVTDVKSVQPLYFFSKVEPVMSMIASENQTDPKALAERYQTIRSFTDQIVEPLSPEDCMVQSMEDVSPARWHLAHTSWFFETFLLPQKPGYQVFDPQFNYLFNSYYNQVGDQFPRPQRGFVSRPDLNTIKEYRKYIDQHMLEFLADRELDDEIAYVLEVGLNHEQQHQELMLTDIKHVFSCNPTLPAYRPEATRPFSVDKVPSERWLEMEEGIYRVGHGGEGFAFDNEGPDHRVFLEGFSIATRPVLNGQVIEFIEDGGYERPDHWLSLGWSTVLEQRWNAPLYWLKREGRWYQFTLSGLVEVDPAAPACHLSYFEADALARWAGHRLPTEFEWEATVRKFELQPLDSDQFADVLMRQGVAIHPSLNQNAELNRPVQMFGGVWEWTRSSYEAYPGYAPPSGALGEYNGKFMCNQYVLRGGSVATSQCHIRSTYRNFFPPQARWQFSGLRLVK